MTIDQLQLRATLCPYRDTAIEMQKAIGAHDVALLHAIFQRARSSLRTLSERRS